MPRHYHQKQRARSQEETRQRIIAAAVELHITIGPAQTTISAIAERAGVERMTYYRHFPDEQTLLAACAHHYLVTHPLPDPALWNLIAEPYARLRLALAEVYAYYRRTEQRWVVIHRDAQVLPQLQQFATPYLERWKQMREVLAVAWEGAVSQERLLKAALGHALDFHSWRSLTRQQGLDDHQAIDLMVAMISCLETSDETSKKADSF